MKKDPRIKILILSGILAISVGVLLGILSTKEDEDIGEGTPKIEIADAKIDLGTISMADGNVKGEFTFTNTGDGNLKITDLQTSCMCTTVVLKVGDKESQKFGMHNNPAFWSEIIRPGETATLDYVFDPLAHGPEGTGPITRQIAFFSNDGGQKNAQTVFTFTGEVVK